MARNHPTSSKRIAEIFLAGFLIISIALVVAIWAAGMTEEKDLAARYVRPTPPMSSRESPATPGEEKQGEGDRSIATPAPSAGPSASPTYELPDDLRDD